MRATEIRWLPGHSLPLAVYLLPTRFLQLCGVSSFAVALTPALRARRLASAYDAAETSTLTGISPSPFSEMYQQSRARGPRERDVATYIIYGG
jgi:hypothetical protein